jgi:hypothetical protein
LLSFSCDHQHNLIEFFREKITTTIMASSSTTLPSLSSDNGEDHELVLVPFGLGAKYLKPFRFNRDLFPQTMLLGRNVETGLDKSCPNVLYVSRSHVSICVKENRKIMISAIARQERVVAFNGKVLADRVEAEIPIGSTFSLLGSIGWFNYALVTSSTYEVLKNTELGDASILSPPTDAPAADLVVADRKRDREEEEEDEKVEPVACRVKVEDALFIGPAVKNESIKSIANAPVSKNVLRGLFHQFDCPICYDTMAATCTLFPCGCNFCYHCIETWYCIKKKSTCPCCNQNFALPNSAPNKRMDTTIRDFMKALQVNKETMNDWEDRVLVGIQRKQAYSQLHSKNVVSANGVFVPIAALPPPPASGIPPPQRQVETTAAGVAAVSSTPVTREILSELIRARAIQVIAAASRPENTSNTVLQGRAQRAQVVLAQLESQRQAAASAANGGDVPPPQQSTVAQWAATILPQPSIPSEPSQAVADVNVNMVSM